MSAVFKALIPLSAAAAAAAAAGLDFARRPRTDARAATGRYGVQVHRNWTAVRALAPEWNGLLASSSADCIYLSWQWMRAWEQVVGRRKEPLAVVVRDRSGALCGLAPFYVTEYSFLGTMKRRVLRTMGDQPTGAEYPDWIARRGEESEICSAIAGALAANSDAWDALWMPQVSGWTGAHERILQAAAGAGLTAASRPTSFSSFELPASIEAFEQMLTANRRKQFRSQRSKILRSSAVSITRCRTVEEVPEYLAALFDLHTRRRQALGEQGTFVAHPEETRFYRHFVPAALEKGWLWLSALRDNGVIKAIQLGYVYGNAYHQLQEGFDPSYTPGAGNVLRLEVIRECINAGLKEYDFLGGYSDHKRRWLAQERFGHDIMIGSSLIDRGLMAAGVWPTGKYLRPAE